MDHVNLAVAYHSGFGHTGVLAEAVASGARDGGAHARTVAVNAMAEADWQTLDGADGGRGRPWGAPPTPPDAALPARGGTRSPPASRTPARRAATSCRR
jgi:hypothetical protein